MTRMTTTNDTNYTNQMRIMTTTMSTIIITTTMKTIMSMSTIMVTSITTTIITMRARLRNTASEPTSTTVAVHSI